MYTKSLDAPLERCEVRVVSSIRGIAKVAKCRARGKYREYGGDVEVEVEVDTKRAMMLHPYGRCIVDGRAIRKD